MNVFFNALDNSCLHLTSLAHPVEPLCLEDVAVDLVQLPPASGAAPVDAAVLALALHAGGRGHAGEHCKRREERERD